MRRRAILIAVVLVVLAVGLFVWGESRSNGKDCWAASSASPTTITVRCGRGSFAG